MKNKCSVGAKELAQINTEVGRAVLGSRFANEGIDKLIIRINKLVEKISNSYIIEDPKTIAENIEKTLKQMGVFYDQFTAEYFTNLITDIESGTAGNSKKVSTESLYDTEATTRKKEANNKFLDNAYGSALEVRSYAERQQMSYMVDSVLVNRGTFSSALGAISDSRTLNDNIREYHQLLLDQMVEYLSIVCTEQNTSKEHLELLKNARMYKTEGSSIEYTNILEKLHPLINNFLDPKNYTSESLRRLYYNSLHHKDIRERELNKLRLQAFNANIFLKHFDTYITKVFGKALDIKDFGIKNGQDKYNISERTNELSNTWKNSEEFDMTEEVDNITKLLVNTLPLYEYGIDTPLSNRYITFQDFVYIMGKVKALGQDPRIAEVVFNATFIKNNRNIWESLSENTGKYIRGKSLSYVINSIRQNPRKILPIVFELLANVSFGQLYSSSFFDNKSWSKMEKQRLYSIAKGLFLRSSSSVQKSLFEIVGPNPKIDYFNFIAQTADSTFKKSFIQYYIDFDGVAKTRPLINLQLYNISQKFKQDTNSKNGKTLIKDYDSVRINYNIQDIIKDDIFHGILYTIPNTNITVQVYSKTNRIEVTQNGKPFNKGFAAIQEENPEVIEFIEKVLPISLDADFVQTLMDIDGSQIQNALLGMASRVILNQYISNTLLKQVPTRDVSTILESTYGINNTPKYNKATKQLDLISPTDNAFVENIALTKATIQGLMTASQVKDSNQASQSTQSFSMLLGSYPSQWALVENKENSPTKDLILMNLPGLFLGHESTSEGYQQGSKGKKTVKFTASELAYSNFMLNFVQALSNPNSNDFVSNKKALFLASVNSDKNTIGQLRIDLNTKIPGFDKSLIDLDNKELESLISDQFYEFYSKIFKNISNDFKILENHIKNIQDKNGNKIYENFPNLSRDYDKGFAAYNNWCLQRGKNPIDFIKNAVADYNKTHRLNPLQFVDQLHFAKGDSQKMPNGKTFTTITNNEVLIENILRFRKDVNTGIPTNLVSFMQAKHREMVQSMINTGFRVNLSKNTHDNEYLKNNYKDWVTDSNMLILAKVVIEGQEYSISSNVDLREIGIKTGLSEEDILKQPQFRAHPLLAKYNVLEYFITQSWMFTTVGSHISQKAKGSDILEKEASQFLAQHKRNVSMTAQKQEFQLNTIQGVPEYYNISIIEDINIEKPLIKQLSNSITPYDGATIVNPFVVLLENLSLAGARAGITKKQFVHFKNDRTGTGGIIKTAGFGMTNDWIRNSKRLQDLMKKMTSRTWLDEDGSEAIVDITKDFMGNDFFFGNLFFKGFDGNHYRIKSIRPATDDLGVVPNRYIREIVQVTSDGQDIDGSNPYIKTENSKVYHINNNYALWKLFGGFKSEQLIENKRLLYSENSIKKVVELMNAIGTVKNTDGIIETQDDFWQPLKHSDDHYLVTTGAIKHGAANINSKNKFTTESNDLDSQRIRIIEAGIQLDKEHHADDSELSLPTQIVSACASRGYSYNEAAQLYTAIQRATELGIQEQLELIGKANIKASDKIKLYGETIKLVVNNLVNSSKSTSFAQLIAESIQQQMASDPNYDLSKSRFPLSDRTVFRKVLSTVSSYITKQSIKLKVPGILSVLTPSHDIFKLYGGRKLESFDNPEVELQQLQEEQVPAVDINFNYQLNQDYFLGFNIIYDNNINSIIERDDQTITINIDLLRSSVASYYNPNLDMESAVKRTLLTEYYKDLLERKQDEKQETFDERVTKKVEEAMTMHISNVDLGRAYLVTKRVSFTNEFGETGTEIIEELLELETPEQLRNLRKQVEAGNVTKVVEYIIDGRNLGAYNVRFKTDMGRYQLWELDSVKNMHEFPTNEADYLKEQDKWSHIGSTYKEVKNRLYARMQADLMLLSPNAENPAKQFLSVLARFNSDGNLKAVNNFISLKYKIPVNFSTIEEAKVFMGNMCRVSINGVKHVVDQQSIEIQPYELIMAKTFLNEFGFDTFTDLYEVENNKNYFVEQYIKNQTTIPQHQFDVVLKNSNGKHIYLMDRKRLEGSGLKPSQQEIRTIEENGHILRVDQDEEVIYELFPNAEIYVDDNGTEVIVISDTEERSAIDTINSYVSTIPFGIIEFSENMQNYSKDLLDLVQKLKLNHKVGKYISNKITPKGNITEETVLEHLRKIWSHKITLENYKELPEDHRIIQAGREKHTAFLKSLDIVAARIPSQSKQSYMAMKVVAYDNPNINTAHVSTLQILLQGSDFDIDAVSLVTFNINKSGKLDLWSPYMNHSDKKLLDMSMKYIPIPSGNELNVDMISNEDIIKKQFQDLKYIFAFDPILSKIGQVDSIRVRMLPIDSHKQFQILAEFLNNSSIYRHTNDILMFQKLREQGILEAGLKDAKDTIDSIYKQLEEYYNEHNLYLDKLDNRTLSNVVNNITTHSLYQSIVDPIDLMQSQESVDGPTKPIQKISKNSKSNELAKTRTPGNWMNKIESILENQEGKDCISICAVGLKTFFALSQYYNKVLNSGNLEDQVRLIANSKSNDIPRFLANTVALNPETIVHEEVVEILISRGFEEDQAVVLSALLGLSADNAKELTLAKLNAGSKMISAYLYGISIGKDFKEIADLMMSRTGLLLKEVLDGNIFEGTLGKFDLLDAINHFTSNPYKALKKFDVKIDSNKEYIQPITFNDKTVETPLEFLNAVLKAEYNVNNIFEYNDKIEEDLATRFKFLDHAKTLWNNDIGKDIYLQLIDYAKQYLMYLNDIDPIKLNQIKSLAKGAKEMKTLGAILGLNQGIPSEFSKLLNKCAALEDVFIDLGKDAKKAALSSLGSEYVDIHRFAFEPDYRETCIDIYNHYKHTFNILDCIAKSPHFLGYVQALAVAKSMLESSFKFNNLSHYYKKINIEYDVYDKELAIKGLENFLSDYILKEWLFSQTLELPAGNYLFNDSGFVDDQVTTDITPLNLGSSYDQAAFRLWMESEVIPNLKKGIINDTGNISTMVATNPFIKDLTNSDRSNTVSGNSSIIYTLPINMLPRTEIEEIALNNYIDNFNALAQFQYSVGLSKPVSIIDLFTYYSMIAHDWTLSENSLVPILGKQQDQGIIKKFHEFEAVLDRSGAILDKNIIRDGIIPYIASKKGPYGGLSKYAWGTDKETGQKTIMIKTSAQEQEELYNELVEKTGDVETANILFSQIVINGYQFKSYKGDSNYFTKNKIKERDRVDTRIINIDGKDVEFAIVWNRDSKSGYIYKRDRNNSGAANYNQQKIHVFNNGELPTKVLFGKMQLDMNSIEAIIKYKHSCK